MGGLAGDRKHVPKARRTAQPGRGVKGYAHQPLRSLGGMFSRLAGQRPGDNQPFGVFEQIVAARWTPQMPAVTVAVAAFFGIIFVIPKWVVVVQVVITVFTIMAVTAVDWFVTAFGATALGIFNIWVKFFHCVRRFVRQGNDG